MNGEVEAAIMRSLDFFTASLSKARREPTAIEPDASNIMHLLDADFTPARASAMLVLSQAFYPYVEARGLFTWAKKPWLWRGPSITLSC
jgi:hypothetical protein